MGRLHLLIGLLSLVAFLISGFFMAVHVPPLPECEPELRLLFRSRHIYLLFAATVNVVVGLNWRPPVGKGRWLRQAGGALFLVSPFLAIAGFIHDPAVGTVSGASYGTPGIFALFAGTMLLLFAEVVARSRAGGPSAR